MFVGRAWSARRSRDLTTALLDVVPNNYVDDQDLCDEPEEITCTTCSGTGTIDTDDAQSLGTGDVVELCPDCLGNGYHTLLP